MHRSILVAPNSRSSSPNESPSASWMRDRNIILPMQISGSITLKETGSTRSYLTSSPPTKIKRKPQMSPITSEHYTLFFTGKDDPRENVVVIGNTTVPIFFRFETPTVIIGETRTNVYRNDELVSTLNWILGTHLGTANVVGQYIDMSKLVAPGSDDSSYRFSGCDGNTYEWRNIAHGEYDLTALANNARVAEFRKASVETPVGQAHAVLHLTFDSEMLVLETLLSLCLTRWASLHGL